MGRRGLGRFTVFLLVFVGTIAVVAVLSQVTHVSTETAAARYMEALREQQEPEAEVLSAPASGHPGISWAESLAGFFAIMLVPVVGLLAFLRSRHMGKPRQGKGRRQEAELTIERSGRSRV